jgi:hypothetical protein
MADPRFLNPITILPRFGGITIDRTERVSESYTSQVTENPVEEETAVSEYVIDNPTIVSMKCTFVDTPSTNLSGSFTGALGTAKTKFDSLLSLKATKETFSFMNGIHLFSPFLFTSIELIKEDPKYSIDFTVTMKQVNKVKAGISSFSSFSGFTDLSQNPLLLRAAYVTPILLSTGSAATSDVEPFGVLL